MPRKVNYGVDYEEDFYDYEDYNYDYDDGHEYAETNATSDKVEQSNVSKKEIAGEVKKELVSEEPTSSSASTAKVRRDNMKDRGSSIKSRGYHGVMSNVGNMSVSSNPRNAESRIAPSRSQTKPQKIVCTDQLEDKLNQLNLAIVGHVDSGKSTLSGRLLHLLGQISQKEMHKYEKEAKQQVLVIPSREMATVRSLEHNSQVCNSAKAGDNVTVNLQGIDVNRVMAGDVLCHPEYPIAVTNHLELKILLLDIAVPILIGSQLEFHVHHVKEAARVVRILSLLDPKTGKETKKSPRCLLAKQNAIIEVVLQGIICVEEHSKCKGLGRVSLRASGRTIALGLVTRVLEKKE